MMIWVSYTLVTVPIESLSTTLVRPCSLSLSLVILTFKTHIAVGLVLFTFSGIQFPETQSAQDLCPFLLACLFDRIGLSVSGGNMFSF